MPDGSVPRRLFQAVLCASGLLAAPIARPVTAQDRPGPAIEATAGWAAFADDGIVSEPSAGGAVRWYLLPRLSAGPEIVHIDGHNHTHLVLTGNLSFDMLAPGNGRPA
ncbi:MAG: hypothetical protein V7647_2253 [Acidobacteriota bacterium]